MGSSGFDACASREGADALADRKQAERERLAAALRANLSRRKAQSRDRRNRDQAAENGLESAAAHGKDPAEKS